VEWEAQFSAAIALLRSVGHVLEKKAKADWWWKEITSNKAAHSIFFEFVHCERNLILKEGELRAGQSATVFLAGASSPAAPPPTLPKAIYSYHMNDGVFADRDPRDLIDEAIVWWDAQLTKIDRFTPFA
jgi:hypothetical protein